MPQAPCSRASTAAARAAWRSRGTAAGRSRRRGRSQPASSPAACRRPRRRGRAPPGRRARTPVPAPRWPPHCAPPARLPAVSSRQGRSPSAPAPCRRCVRRWRIPAPWRRRPKPGRCRNALPKACGRRDSRPVPAPPSRCPRAGSRCLRGRASRRGFAMSARPAARGRTRRRRARRSSPAPGRRRRCRDRRPPGERRARDRDRRGAGRSARAFPPPRARSRARPGGRRRSARSCSRRRSGWSGSPRNRRPQAPSRQAFATRSRRPRRNALPQSRSRPLFLPLSLSCGRT